MPIKKPTWQEKVRELEAYQAEHELSLRDLSEESGQSIGHLSYALKLAAALHVYPELEKMKKLVEAIEFLKNKKFIKE